MNLFALSDLHLSLQAPFALDDPQTLAPAKTMGIFGDGWQDHIAKIAANWQRIVGPDDVVLVAGDISWAMTLAEAEYDLQFLGALNGRKILLRGNHDYWWHSVKKIEAVLPPGVTLLQNNAVMLGDLAIAGCRFWTLPGSNDFSADDRKVYERELIRAELSLQAAGEREVIFMSHFMPFNEEGDSNELIELLAAHRVSTAIYGHIHGKKPGTAAEGLRHGIDFLLTSCDYLACTPKLIRAL